MTIRNLLTMKEDEKNKNIDYKIKNLMIKRKSKYFKNIILDMDKTLIEGYFSIKHDKVMIEERPYLAQFLKFVFTHFDNVSIWTNANKVWFDSVYETVLHKYVPKDKYFDFVFTFDDGFVGKDNNGAKDLNIVFRYYEDHNYEYNKHNTFLVDDSEIHFYKNPYNCYLIKPFEVDIKNNEHKNDIELLRFIKIFRV